MVTSTSTPSSILMEVSFYFPVASFLSLAPILLNVPHYQIKIVLFYVIYGIYLYFVCKSVYAHHEGQKRVPDPINMEL
jgi:Ca2+/Na+ antiporter